MTQRLQHSLTLAQRHHAVGELSEAKGIYRKILRDAPNHPIALHLMGVIAYQNRENDVALDFIKKALIIKPDYAEAHNNLGVIFKELKEIDEAITCYKRALTINNDYAEAHYNLGVVLKEIGKLDEAITSYKRALEHKPDYAEALYNLGNSLNECGELEEAIASYRETITIKPDYAEAHSNLGNVLKIIGKPNEAEFSYRKALAIRPDYAEAHSNLGAVLRELGRLNDAEESYKKALSIKPDFAETHSNLGHVLHALGKFNEAADSLRKAVGIEPDLPGVQHRLNALLGITTDFAPRQYVEDIFNSYAKKFDNHLVNVLKYDAPIMLKKALLDLGLAQRKYKNVIDLGCGTGLSGLEFRDIAETLIGIDLSEEMVRKAEQKNIYDQLYVDDIVGRLEILKTQFSLFISSDVFAYIGDLLPLFSCIKRHSTQNSLLVFSTEHTDDGDFILRNTARYAHSKDYILSIAKQQGFRLEFFTTCNLRYERDGWIIGGLFVLKVT
ncbi:MAG TPA: tetratricopeptide repeat protein [Rhodospirillales bacterium]|nr:tetratricopeptide repeat protein [Rhodospirillales bacterium]HIB22578.1 tetratricopeptide repeat protein [Rhodospirillales bacterium]